MIATRMRRTVGSAVWLLRLSGWTCVWLVLPLLAAVGQEADGHRQSAVPPADKILATLRPEHPRVLATSQTFEAVRASVRGERLPARIYAEVKKSAEQTLSVPVSKYELPDGKRLLSVSRRVLDRFGLWHWCIAWRAIPGTRIAPGKNSKPRRRFRIGTRRTSWIQRK